jgi:hypothetical protein
MRPEEYTHESNMPNGLTGAVDWPKLQLRGKPS